jgi:hypothetical protein
MLVVDFREKMLVVELGSLDIFVAWDILFRG